MNTFSRGQKGKLTELGCVSPFSVTIDLASQGLNIDVSCFGLDASDKLADERFMVFFNQLASPDQAITLDLGSGKAVFNVNLSAVPESIEKLVFTAAIDGQGALRSVGSSSMEIGNAVTFPFSGADFHDEKAAIVGEIYRKDGQWRFGAVGQGFNGGLSALLSHFGGAEATPSAPSTPSAPTNVPAQASAAPEPKKVSLSKITLEKRGDKVSLDKRGGKAYGRIHINLNWNQNPSSSTAPEKPGFLSRIMGGDGKAKKIDLDLACMFEMSDGRPGLVQALGECWGDFTRAPFIHLEGDDRTGTATDGENIFVNGEFFDKIKRALVFTFIYEGVPNWAATDAVVTIAVPEQAPIEVKLDQGGNQMMCAVAMIENNGGNLQVTKLVDYFAQQGNKSAHELMDRKYGFGLQWTTGSKN